MLKQVRQSRGILNTSILLPMLLLVWGFCCINANAQKRSSYQSRAREGVAIDCDTALTSDLRIVRRPYYFSDNIFWGINLGANKSLSSESADLDFFPMVRPSAGFFLGKYFTPWISASLNLDYDMHKEGLTLPVDTTYSFHSVSALAEGQLCLNRLFTRYNNKERFLVYAVAGAGMQASFAYDDIAPESKTKYEPVYRVGAMLEWRASEKTGITLRGMWNGDMAVSLGIVRRLPNHYASRSFQNCRGNEIYYFGNLEERLLKDHQRQLKRYHKGKAEAPIMAAEQDSVIIFPYGYAYLTPQQEAKLDKAALRLAGNPQKVLVIDLYPIVNDDPKMTPAQAIQRCEVAIRHYMLKERDDVQEKQLRFVQHKDEQSPIADQSIWVHGAILHYE